MSGNHSGVKEMQWTWGFDLATFVSARSCATCDCQSCLVLRHYLHYPQLKLRTFVTHIHIPSHPIPFSARSTQHADEPCRLAHRRAVFLRDSLWCSSNRPARDPHDVGEAQRWRNSSGPWLVWLVWSGSLRCDLLFDLVHLPGLSLSRFATGRGCEGSPLGGWGPLHLRSGANACGLWCAMDLLRCSPGVWTARPYLGGSLLLFASRRLGLAMAGHCTFENRSVKYRTSQCEDSDQCMEVAPSGIHRCGSRVLCLQLAAAMVRGAIFGQCQCSPRLLLGLSTQTVDAGYAFDFICSAISGSMDSWRWSRILQSHVCRYACWHLTQRYARGHGQNHEVDTFLHPEPATDLLPNFHGIVAWKYDLSVDFSCSFLVFCH